MWINAPFYQFCAIFITVDKLLNCGIYLYKSLVNCENLSWRCFIIWLFALLRVTMNRSKALKCHSERNWEKIFYTVDLKNRGKPKVLSDEKLARSATSDAIFQKAALIKALKKQNGNKIADTSTGAFEWLKIENQK